jgi:hypothetical protein
MQLRVPPVCSNEVECVVLKYGRPKEYDGGSFLGRVRHDPVLQSCLHVRHGQHLLHLGRQTDSGKIIIESTIYYYTTSWSSASW